MNSAMGYDPGLNGCWATGPTLGLAWGNEMKVGRATLGQDEARQIQ
jgi:hypothetical protein